MFVPVFNDAGDISMINSILRKHKYQDGYKHFSDLSKLYLKKTRKL